MIDRIKQLLRDNPTWDLQDVAEQLGISLGDVNFWMRAVDISKESYRSYRLPGISEVIYIAKPKWLVVIGGLHHIINDQDEHVIVPFKGAVIRYKHV